jgi:xylan 1,4-beta-xylosidase
MPSNVPRRACRWRKRNSAVTGVRIAPAPETRNSKVKLFQHLLAFLAVWFSSLLYAQESVSVQVDASRALGPLRPVWAYFGYDEPNYTYMEHGRELIGELEALSAVPVHIRTHNLLTTGDGTASLKWGSTNAYTEDATGHPIYDWKIMDHILGTYLEASAKPFVEIGFMPEALSKHPQPYQHTFPKGDIYTGWAYPPTDYRKWAELVRHWVEHCVERYGKAEVRTWDWEVWNEPNIGYWHGTPAEFDQLYDYAVDAVRLALPEARVGGPATTGPSREPAAAFLKQFLEHCARGTNFATGKTGAPLDFITFHAKGSPKVSDGRVQMGLANHLRDVDQGFAIVTSFPEFAALPIVLSESDPEGCAACSARVYPQNAYRNGTLYPAYTATAMRNMLELAERRRANLEGILTWAFEFEGQPYFDGFRTLATNGVDKPVLNLFRMLGLMRGERVKTESSGGLDVDQILQSGVRQRPDVNALAARSEHSVHVLVWNYHDNDHPGPDSPVKVRVAGLPTSAQRVLENHYRIDQDHSNAYTVWKEMGSPQNPTLEQYAKLKAAGQLQLLDSPRWLESKAGALDIEFLLPRQAVSLVELSW